MDKYNQNKYNQLINKIKKLNIEKIKLINNDYLNLDFLDSNYIYRVIFEAYPKINNCIHTYYILLKTNKNIDSDNIYIKLILRNNNINNYLIKKLNN